MCVNSARAKLPEYVSARKWVHGPGDADTYREKQKERPQYVLDAVFRTAASQKTEGHGNNRSEHQQSLKMRQGNHALRPRAAS